MIIESGDFLVNTFTRDFLYKGGHVYPCKGRPEKAVSLEGVAARLLGRLKEGGDTDWLGMAIGYIERCAPYSCNGFTRRDTAAHFIGVDGRTISRWLKDYAEIPYLKVELPAKSGDLGSVQKMTLPGVAVRATGTISVFHMVPLMLAIAWFQRHQQYLKIANRTPLPYKRVTLVR